MKSKYNFFALLLVGLIFWSCTASQLPSAFKGYKKLENGVFYKFLNQKKTVKTPNLGDVCEFNTIVLKDGAILNSTYLDGRTQQRIVSESDDRTAVEKILPLMTVGDSVSIAILVDSLSSMPSGFSSGQWMELQVKVEKVLKKEMRVTESKKSLDGLEKHPTLPFAWKQHRKTNKYKPKTGDQVLFYFTLRKGEEISYQTRKGLPDIIPMPAEQLSPMHIAMREMSEGDSVTVAFEVTKLDAAMKKSVEQSGFFDGDILVMDIGILEIRTKKEVEEQKKEMERQQEQDIKNAQIKGKRLDRELPKRIKQYQAGKLNLQKTEKGVKYIVHKKGKGALVQKGQTIIIHYNGFLTNQATKFQSSYDIGRTINFKFGEGKVIQGWEDVIAKLPIGTEATIFIPYSLAYGEQGNTNKVPPYANLTFYIEILGTR